MSVLLKISGFLFPSGKIKLESGNSITGSKELLSKTISLDTIKFTVECADPLTDLLSANEPMTYIYTRAPKCLADAFGRPLLTRDGSLIAPRSGSGRQEQDYSVFMQKIYYLQSVTRVGPDRYTLYGLTPVGRLARMAHPGGIYTGQRAEEVVADICGDVPVIVKTSLADVRLYGWLPYVKPDKSSARDNLAQVLFALGAYLDTDLNGVLRVQTYWNGMAAVIGSGRVYQGAAVTYEDRVSAVTVSEHQYIPGQEEATLFDGTAQEGDLVTFNEPAHSLSASGFSILGSGANWARLSAGTGTLTGKAYVHTTREIRETVDEGAEENMKTEDSCTLASLVNSRAAAQRLAAYYKCRETIECSIVARSEKPGHVVGIYHPYDKVIVPACVSSMDTTVSSILKSEVKALSGFEPPQYAQSVGYDRRILLTGTGEFAVPEGVTHIRGVLIEEGAGGWSGLPGEEAPEQKTVSASGGTQIQRLTKYYTEGGKGGKAGEGGTGGKIYQFEMDVEPGQRFAYSCGPGGPGGASGGEESLPGSSGTATVFGAHSSAEGSYSPSGFLDPVSNQVFGADGEPGIDGGKGCGSGGESNSLTPVAGEPVTFQGKTYYPGNATKTVRTADYTIGRYEWLQASWTEGLGGGAAAGNSGQDGGEDGYYRLRSTGASAKGGRGGDGADAAAPAAEARYGRGGTGGNGGGGAGSPGIAEVVHLANSDVTPSSVSMGVAEAGAGIPGRGSDGGRGGPGCVLLYFTAYQENPGGALMTRDGEFVLGRLGRLFVV